VAGGVKKKRGGNDIGIVRFGKLFSRLFLWPHIDCFWPLSCRVTKSWGAVTISFVYFTLYNAMR